MFSILIPTYNNLEYLRFCIKSLKKNSHFNNRIILFYGNHHHDYKKKCKIYTVDAKIFILKWQIIIFYLLLSFWYIHSHRLFFCSMGLKKYSALEIMHMCTVWCIAEHPHLFCSRLKSFFYRNLDWCKFFTLKSPKEFSPDLDQALSQGKQMHCT